MDKGQLLRLSENPDFISGIFNYCDRWCAHCAFTSRCLLYATERELFPNARSHDISNEEFWVGMHHSFELAMELVNDHARAQGIDLTGLDLSGERSRLDSSRQQAEEHPLVQAAKQYATMAAEWLTLNTQLFNEKEGELTKDLALNIGNTGSAAGDIHEAMEVIRWYQHLIRVKLMRALEGEEPELEAEEDEETGEYPRDSDGSAKVALIAIDRSIRAWGKLQRHFGDQMDSVVDILVHLSRLRASAENHFACARSFVRPGFNQDV
jgi:hypothetical protein